MAHTILVHCNAVQTELAHLLRFAHKPPVVGCANKTRVYQYVFRHIGPVVDSVPICFFVMPTNLQLIPIPSLLV